MTNPEFSDPVNPPNEAEVLANVAKDVAAIEEAESEKYVYVRMPNGSVVPVPASEIHEANATVKQDTPVRASVPVVESQYYVHLANGDVLRVSESDLPGGHGSNNPLGHWQRGNKVHTVIGVYPVEAVAAE